MYPGRVHVLRFEDIVADPVRVLGGSWRKLGVGSAPTLAKPSWNGKRARAGLPLGHHPHPDAGGQPGHRGRADARRRRRRSATRDRCRLLGYAVPGYGRHGGVTPARASSPVLVTGGVGLRRRLRRPARCWPRGPTSTSCCGPSRGRGGSTDVAGPRHRPSRRPDRRRRGAARSSRRSARGRCSTSPPTAPTSRRPTPGAILATNILGTLQPARGGRGGGVGAVREHRQLVGVRLQVGADARGPTGSSRTASTRSPRRPRRTCAPWRRGAGRWRVVTFRLFSVYGPWEEPTRLIPTLIRRARAGLPLEMVAPDTARDFVYVDDVLGRPARLRPARRRCAAR